VLVIKHVIFSDYIWLIGLPNVEIVEVSVGVAEWDLRPFVFYANEIEIQNTLIVCPAHRILLGQLAQILKCVILDNRRVEQHNRGLKIIHVQVPPFSQIFINLREHAVELTGQFPLMRRICVRMRE